MEKLKQVLNNVFLKFKYAIEKYPFSIFNILIVAVLAIFNIAIESDFGSNVTNTINILQFTFLLNGVFSLAIVSYEEAKEEKLKIKYVLYLLVPLLTFLYLYYFNRYIEPGYYTMPYYVNNAYGIYRVFALIFIFGMLFILFVSKYKNIQSFGKIFLIFNEAIFVSLFNAGISIVGFYGVLGAFQSLIYEDLSYKVYSYLAITIMFLAYVMFLSYFPKNQEEQYELKTPKFIEDIISKVLVVIMLALGFVLIGWIFRVVVLKVEVEFLILSSIVTAFVLFGLWLYILVDRFDTKLVKFYKLMFNVVSIVVLLAQMLAFVSHYRVYGLDNSTYGFTLVWIFGILSVIILLFIKENKFEKSLLVATSLLTISILPFIGQYDLPYNNQSKRLIRLLENNNMLADSQIIKRHDLERQEAFLISNSVRYLQNAKLNHRENIYDILVGENSFVDTFGFEMVYRLEEDDSNRVYVVMRIDHQLLDISDYDYGIALTGIYDDEVNFTLYDSEFNLQLNYADNTVILNRDNQEIISIDIEAYIFETLGKYSGEGEHLTGFEELMLTYNLDDIEVRFVLNYIEMSKYSDEVNYFFEINSMFIKEQ